MSIWYQWCSGRLDVKVGKKFLCKFTTVAFNLTFLFASVTLNNYKSERERE